MPPSETTVPQVSESVIRQGSAVETNVDSCDLAFLVTVIRARHPLVQTLTKMLG